MTTKNNYTVYEHIFPNGKRYIGVTKQSVNKRWGNGNGYKDCPKVYGAIQKYGWENVKHNILYEGLTKTEAESKEIELIAFYNTTKEGYNIEYGGNVVGTHSEETKRKISEGNKGKKKGPCSEERKRKLSKLNSGTGNPFFGRHHTKEVREAQSEFMRNNTYFKGHHHSEDFKKMKSKQMHEKYKDGKNPRCRTVLMKDSNGKETIFYSLRQATRQTGIALTTLQKAVKNQQQLNGCQWRYANE